METIFSFREIGEKYSPLRKEERKRVWDIYGEIYKARSRVNELREKFGETNEFLYELAGAAVSALEELERELKSVATSEGGQ